MMSQESLTPEGLPEKSRNKSELGQQTASREFPKGATVIYGRHGKCRIVSIEIRLMGGHEARYYRLEVIKSPFARSGKQESAIWVPVDSAFQQGMRSPMSPEDAQKAIQVLGKPEEPFDTTSNWVSIRQKIEAGIRQEGPVGLAKAINCFQEMKRKQYLLNSEANRMYEDILKQLQREISEATQQPPEAIEGQLNKLLRLK